MFISSYIERKQISTGQREIKCLWKGDGKKGCIHVFVRFFAIPNKILQSPNSSFSMNINHYLTFQRISIFALASNTNLDIPFLSFLRKFV